MFGGFEILVGIIGAIVIQVATFVMLRLKMTSAKPEGSISIERTLNADGNRRPGNIVVQLVIVMGFVVYVIIFLTILSSCITSSWKDSTLYAEAVRFPVWVNWIGVAGLWFFGFWKAAFLAYNTNFTLFFLPMKDDYTLATGGPYRFVRHPAYAAWLILIPSFFLMTGVLWLLAALIVWPLCIYQALSDNKLETVPCQELV